MDAKFAEVTDSLHGSFEQLLAMAPVKHGAIPKNPALSGVYLFSENGKHLYVGRSRNIRNRYDAHTLPCSRQYSAAFAMILAREKTGRKASYKTGPDSRKGLMLDTAFCEVFAEQKRRIQKMDFRCVGESRPVQQTLLEVYCAIVLKTQYNDFDTH